MEMYTFPGCGCQWPVTGPPNYPGGPPRIKLNYRKLPLCSAVVDLFASGRTRGVFQLEKQLGQTWAKRVAPTTQAEVAALTSVLRPGCIRAKDEFGDSVTKRYADRKNGRQDSGSLHPSVEGALGSTYNEMLYQEQLLNLARELAGYDLAKADNLRRAVAKKNASLLASIKVEFLQGCQSVGKLPDDKAVLLWEQIEKSGRYLFSLNHAWSYGGITINTAYLKAHDPVAFFATWVGFGHLKGDSDDEMLELVDDAKLFGVSVRAPDLRLRNPRVVVKHGEVVMGLCDISGISDTSIKKMFDKIDKAEKKVGKPLADWDWPTYLIHASDGGSATLNNNMFGVGALSYMKIPRLRMMAEYDVFRKLSPIERNWVKANITAGESLAACIKRGSSPKKDGGMLAVSSREPILSGLLYYLENPPALLIDTPFIMADLEEKLLGVSVTATKIMGKDISGRTLTCDQLLERPKMRDMRVAVEIKRVHPHISKNGNEMAYLTIADETATISDMVIFSDALSEFKDIIRVSNTVLLEVVPSNRGDGFIVNHASQL